MEVHEKLGELAALVSGARGVPLSSSAVVDREQVLRLVAEVRRLLPAEVQQAGDVLAQRDEVLASAADQADKLVSEAQARADELVAGARAQAEELVDAQAVTRASRERADHIVATAREEAKRLRVDADAWCDAKLGDFAEELERLQQQARRGRDRLKHRGPETADAEPSGETSTGTSSATSSETTVVPEDAEESSRPE